jgi:hypothetical protein
MTSTWNQNIFESELTIFRNPCGGLVESCNTCNFKLIVFPFSVYMIVCVDLQQESEVLCEEKEVEIQAPCGAETLETGLPNVSLLFSC